ncbi:aspartate/glutamate racemase family protein [Spartinivicinus poritis]|uniref:Aspartate/glutamate racemase family protein n=1 Tax=Spartinivicinus poritis TaxID=2994640 RepID=A0ABT5UF92_9GAMM|nr:aspartate/glutamate racemase family protein [Spartinivicinus sp. A2-2]MDE1465055.1 aspartate/glutamate racemase family protein [Spartinivicinus sp. A2-2]
MPTIDVITAFPHNPDNPLRTINDFDFLQSENLTIRLRHNPMGSIHGQSDIEHEFSKPGMALAALDAEKSASDAIVIESMGDTALRACRELVNIPVVGMADSSMRVATSLGRKFAIITVCTWHALYLEELIRQYGVINDYVGFEILNLQPFFLDLKDKTELMNKLLNAVVKTINEKDADTIILGGSYFLGIVPKLQHQLVNRGYCIPVIDPLMLAIFHAKMLVETNLSHSKICYPFPQKANRVLGYSGIESTPTPYLR